MDGRAVVELARAAVGRLGAAAPIADAARDAAAAIEKFGVGPPYTVAIAGDLAARSALLDCLAGEPLFDARRREPARIVMSMRRGAATGLRARHRDGSVEQRMMSTTASGAVIVDESAIVEELDAIVYVPQRLPWWAVWRRLMRWFRSWRDRRAAPRSKRRGELRRKFAESVRELSARDVVERLFVEIGGGPLPEQVVVVELPPRADPKGLAAIGADACFVACTARSIALTKQLRESRIRHRMQRGLAHSSHRPRRIR